MDFNSDGDFMNRKMMASELSKIARLLIGVGTIRLDKGKIRQFIMNEVFASLTDSLWKYKWDEKIGVVQKDLSENTIVLKSAVGLNVKINVIVQARVSGSKDFVMAGRSYVVKDDGIPLKNYQSATVYIFLNGSFAPGDFFKNKESENELKNQLYRMAIHEFTHAVDLSADVGPSYFKKDRTDKGYSTSADIDNAIYYNSPREVRAYTQGIIEEIQEKIEQIVLSNDDDAIHSKYKYILFEALQSSPTWLRIRKSLNEESKKKVYRVVYHEIDLWVDKLKSGEIGHKTWDDSI